MKKLWMGILAVTLSAMILTGCGDKDKEFEVGETRPPQETNVKGEEAKPLHEMHVEQYVTLGDYGNMEITVAPVSVDEAEVNAVVNDVYVANVTRELGGIVDRAVAVGDTIILDYEGKKDGVAFSGGTAKGASLTIGSGQFIDGFEDGLVGVMPGETVDLNLTFPEAYHSAELAGQAVVFTVTVQYILPAEVAREDMLDEVVALMQMEDASTVDELYESARRYLLENAEETYAIEVENQILQKLVECCEYGEIPEEIREIYRTKVRDSLKQQADYYGVDVDTFTTMAYGLGSEEAVEKYSETTMQQELALQAVANAEGNRISDEDLDARILEWAQSMGYSTVEEFIGTVSKEEYRNYFMSRDVIDFLTENANITEK